MSELDMLRAKISEDPTSFVAILGSGASIPGGLPSWEGLRDILCDTIPDVINEPADAQQAIDIAKNSSDLWHAFSRLKSSLGGFHYGKTIVNALDTSMRNIPRLYKQLWQLNIAGIVNFNLDKFAIDAYSDVNRSTVDFASGNEPHKFENFLLGYNKFVFHPHGIISDRSSWVLDATERRNLYGNSNFKKMMCSILSSKNLLIIGFNPNEFSFLKLLEEVGINGRLNGHHNYCFLANSTPDECRELGEYGISVISYTPTSFLHEELNVFLDSFISFESKDGFLPAVYSGQKYTESDIPNESDCYKYSVGELRNILNGVVASIIPSDTTPTQEEVTKLEQFYNTHIVQLHRAWLVDPRSDSTNMVYGYKVIDSLGSGAFGSVFSAEDASGDRYALKILLPDVKDKISYLNCFRRGIRSMKILRDKGIAGMVKIHNSFEIPACIVMDLVDGITLRTAINNRYMTKVPVKLSVLEQISTIINSAHQLEDRILHRDLKPENVMLENCYSALDFDDVQSLPEVKVLDFDLSWHRGATEQTVMMGAVSQGFMAPEQVDTSADRSLSRSTAVDVYSIGMLAFYMLTEINPLPNQAHLSNFYNELVSSLKSKCTCDWNCFPQYLADTISSATKFQQSERCSLDSLIRNLKIAQEMYNNNMLPNTHPLILQELATRIDPYAEITITEFGRKATVDSKSLSKKVNLATTTDRSRIILNVTIERYISSSDHRDGATKFFQKFKANGLAAVNSSIFHLKEGDSSDYNVIIHLAGQLPDLVSLNYIEQIADNISEIRHKMN